MAAVVIPNFFVVGAPKSGTTSLDAYLAQHPDVFVAAAKEMHHFGSDLAFPRRPSREQYLRCFQDAAGCARVGESSVMYLYSRLAAREIHAFNPAARIIIMLRHPVEMMYSMHGQTILTGDEHLLDFEQACAAEEARVAGRARFRAELPDYLFYRRLADYAPQVRRYFDAFGRGQVHMILFDDLKRDAAGVYRDTLAFLGIDATFRADLSIRNPGKVVRHPRLNRLFRNPPGALRRLSRAVLPGRLRRPLGRAIMEWNVRVGERPPLDAPLRQRMTAQLEPSIGELETVLERDLSAWRNAAPPR